jgi:hypothetical protein
MTASAADRDVRSLPVSMVTPIAFVADGGASMRGSLEAFSAGLATKPDIRIGAAVACPSEDSVSEAPEARRRPSRSSRD